MKKNMLAALCCMPLFALAQSSADTGIHFVKGLDWKQVQQKAKAENKYIFVDFYATWCVPCKVMAKNIFPLKEVGDYFNSKFISVAYQMDRLPDDPPAVRASYPDVKLLNDQYRIEAYPTYLMLSSNGVPLHRIIGSVPDAKQFLAETDNTFKPEKQYYAFVDHYRKNKNDSAVVRDMLLKTISFSDYENMAEVCNSYIGSIRNPFSYENFSLILKAFSRTIKSANSKDFRFLLASVHKVDTAHGVKARLSYFLTDRIVRDTVSKLFEIQENVLLVSAIVESLAARYPALSDQFRSVVRESFRSGFYQSSIKPLYNPSFILPEWDAFFENVHKRFPDYFQEASRMIEESRYKVYAVRKMWPEYEKWLADYMNKYAAGFNDAVMNDILWYDIFRVSENPVILSRALAWGERFVAKYPDANPQFVDTYANLLYKSGNKSEAIAWENKALLLSLSKKDARQQKVAENTLQKMNNNEKTW